MDIVYINGEFVEKSKAKISVFDRGFLFADGVYEVIPRFNGSFLGFEEHLTRLARSLNEIEISNFDLNVKGIAEELLVKNNIKKENCGLYLQVTRGAGSKRDHSFLKQELKPTVFMMYQPVELKDKSEVAKGYSASTAEDLRWDRCDIKSISLLPNILAKSSAERRGSLEVIFHKNGIVTEGSASNVFIVNDGTVYTPKATKNILGGITREMVVDICTDEGIQFEEKDLSLEDLYGADEIWVTSSTKLVAPIVKLDGKAISHGSSGELWSLLFDKMLKKFS